MESSRTHFLPCLHLSPALWSILRLSSMHYVLVADIGLAVVLLPGAVVPQAPAVVPYLGAVERTCGAPMFGFGN